MCSGANTKTAVSPWDFRKHQLTKAPFRRSSMRNVIARPDGCYAETHACIAASSIGSGLIPRLIASGPILVVVVVVVGSSLVVLASLL